VQATVSDVGAMVSNLATRLLSRYVWLASGLIVAMLLSRWSGALALNLARVEAVPIWAQIEKGGAFEPDADFRPVNRWLRIALALDSGSERALQFELERDLLETGRPSRANNPIVQAILKSLRTSAYRGFSEAWGEIESDAVLMSREAIARYWWTLATDQFDAEQWDKAVESCQVGFLVSLRRPPDVVRRQYYLALGHQAATMGEAIGRDRAWYLSSKYFWMAGDQTSAAQQARNLLFSSTASQRQIGWAWYMVGLDAEAAGQPYRALEAYQRAINADDRLTLAVIALRRLAEMLSQEKLVMFADSVLAHTVEGLDQSRSRPIAELDGWTLLKYDVDKDFVGIGFDVPGVLFWESRKPVSPQEGGWQQVGTCWLQVAMFPNFAINPGFEWRPGSQERKGIPGFRRNNGRPCHCAVSPDPSAARTGYVAFVQLDATDRDVTLVSEGIVPVKPGDVYLVSIWGRALGGVGSDNWVGGLLGILWHGPSGYTGHYEILGHIRSDAHGTDWVHRASLVRVPEGVTGLQIGLWNKIPDGTGEPGTMFWDDLSLIRVALPSDRG